MSPGGKNSLCPPPPRGIGSFKFENLSNLKICPWRKFEEKEEYVNQMYLGKLFFSKLYNMHTQLPDPTCGKKTAFQFVKNPLMASCRKRIIN